MPFRGLTVPKRILLGESTASEAATKVANNLMRELRDVNVDAANSIQVIRKRGVKRQLLSVRMIGLSLFSLSVYDTKGTAVYSSEDYLTDTQVDESAAFDHALRGETLMTVRLPQATSSASNIGYGPDTSIYTAAVFTPLRAGGSPDGELIGVLGTLQEEPALNASVVSARITGLVIAALSMGLLFVALLSVVGRADRIITVRTDELRKLSAQLKTYSEWFFGKDLLERVLADPNALSLARRERTVMFMDIRSFTAWSEAHTPEEVVGMLNRYYHASETIFQQHGAIKVKISADEAMAVFGRAGVAATAALALRDLVTPMLDLHQLGARVGLHTGPLVEGLLGSDEAKFYDVIGDTVNTAKLIESNVARAEVLASDETCKALEGAALVGASRQVAAKGKGELTVYVLGKAI